MTTTQAYTRQQYFTNECTHEQYYGQFITPYIMQVVKEQIGLQNIKNALTAGDNLNSIPLTRWDALATSIKSNTISEAFRKAGDYPTLAGYVCLLKAAARQLIK
jgi:hypothetical protein